MVKKSKKKQVKPATVSSDKNNQNIKAIKIRVIGIGGGGGNIVSEIASQVSKASFVVANTDVKSLKSCNRNIIKFQFGQDLTHGLGTGMNPELAKTAVKSEKEKIKKLCQGQDLCILVACLGGGTGSGATATFAKISRELGNLTYGIFTLPFKFEGEKKVEIAINSLKEIKSNLNAITILPNEKIFNVINKETPLKEALSAINQFLAESLSGLIETIYQPGLINIDFADFKTIFEGRGKLTYLSTVEIQQKEGAAKEMITKALNSPLYPYTIKGAKGILFNIIGEKKLSLFDVGQISRTISEQVNPEAKIIFGVSHNNKRPNKIKTVLLATDCGMKLVSKRKGVVKRKKTKAKIEVKTQETTDKELESRKKPKNKENLKPLKSKKKNIKKSKPLLPVQELEKPEQEQEKEYQGPEKQNFLNNEKDKKRKNGLEIKKEFDEVEKKLIEKEKIWEKPAFLRKK